MIFTTPDRPHLRGGFIRAHFGLNIIGKQRPYCTLTGTVVSERDATHDRYVMSCGAIHDDVIAAFPELEAFARWHLSSDGVPMHYMENAKFFHNVHNGLVEDNPYSEPGSAARFFVRTCVPLDEDEGLAIRSLLMLDWEHAGAYLESRDDRMRDVYQAEIVEQLPALVGELQAEQGAR